MVVGSEEWFWHTIALALGGRTVTEWKSAMSAPEFHRWVAYYKSRPFDDQARYHQPAALLAAVGAKDGKPIDYWLDFMIPPTVSDVDASVFRAFGLDVPRG
jgi:hypothetical protein